MHIKEDIKHDFRDVLIRPKRSTLTSRAEVDLCREFKLPHSGRKYSGIPIIAANMDNVCTFEMTKALAKFCRIKEKLGDARRPRQSVWRRR